MIIALMLAAAVPVGPPAPPPPATREEAKKAHVDLHDLVKGMEAVMEAGTLRLCGQKRCAVVTVEDGAVAYLRVNF